MMTRPLPSPIKSPFTPTTPRPRRVPRTKERPVLFGRAAHNLFCLLSNFGAQGRNRTTDTAIFSRMLYQLSYLGRRFGREARCGAGRYRGAIVACPAHGRPGAR